MEEKEPQVLVGISIDGVLMPPMTAKEYLLYEKYEAERKAKEKAQKQSSHSSNESSKSQA